MALLDEWQKLAEANSANQQTYQNFWNQYFEVEKGIYEKFVFPGICTSQQPSLAKLRASSSGYPRRSNDFKIKSANKFNFNQMP